MNSRERILLIALIVIVGGGVLLYGGKRWWWDPLVEYNASIKKLTDENDQYKQDLANFEVGRKKLALARLRSLPKEPGQASAEYHLRYLKPLLEDSGLFVEDITPSQNAVKVKVVTPIPNVKEVGHQIISFTVHARGELADLVTAMERMQKTPYEHRIRSLIIDRTDTSAKKGASNRLAIQMTIEALLVSGTKSKPGMPPGIDPKYLKDNEIIARSLIGWGMLVPHMRPDLTPLPPIGRYYDQIPTRNIFVGAPPIEYKKNKVIEVVKGPVEPKSTGPFPPEEYTPAYVYLTHTSPDEKMAWLFNRVYSAPGHEIKLKAWEGSGFQTFIITDENRNYEFFHAKILTVELRQIYFQVKDEVFTVQVGQNLSQAKNISFGKSTFDLEDEGHFDRAFWEAEKAREKEAAANDKNKKDKQGRTTKKTPVKAGG